MQDNTVLFQLEGNASWAGVGDHNSERIEISGFGTCNTMPCTLSPIASASPVHVGAAATINFLANSSRTASPRRSIGGGRFEISYSRTTSDRRAFIDQSKDALPAPSLHSADPNQYAYLPVAGEPLLRFTVMGEPGGVNPPCSFTYGAGRAVLRLWRCNLSTALEGSWNGTTVSRVAPGGPIELVSPGRCLPAAAGGPGLELAREVLPGLEACTTKCIG